MLLHESAIAFKIIQQWQILISDLNRWLARYHHHQCWAQRKPISIQMTGTPCPGKLHRYEGFFIGRFWQPGAWEAICFTCWKTALAAPPLFFLCWPKVSDGGFWNIDQLIFWFLIERIKSRFLLVTREGAENLFTESVRKGRCNKKSVNKRAREKWRKKTRKQKALNSECTSTTLGCQDTASALHDINHHHWNKLVKLRRLTNQPDDSTNQTVECLNWPIRQFA